MYPRRSERSEIGIPRIARITWGSIETDDEGGRCRDDTSIEGLAKRLNNYADRWECVKVIDLDFGCIGPRGAEDLADVLRDTTTIMELSLAGNMLGDVGTAVLSVGLSENSSVEKLYLQATGIGDDGVKSLIGALERNTTLSTLSIANTTAKGDVVDLFERFVRREMAGDVATPRRNEITRSGARALADFVKTNTTLCTLDINGVLGWADLVQELGNALKNNFVLRNCGLNMGPRRGRLATCIIRNAELSFRVAEELSILAEKSPASILTNEFVLQEHADVLCVILIEYGAEFSRIAPLASLLPPSCSIAFVRALEHSRRVRGADVAAVLESGNIIGNTKMAHTVLVHPCRIALVTSATFPQCSKVIVLPL